MQSNKVHPQRVSADYETRCHQCPALGQWSPRECFPFSFSHVSRMDLMDMGRQREALAPATSNHLEGKMSWGD